jgi:hypothetical protein
MAPCRESSNECRIALLGNQATPLECCDLSQLSTLNASQPKAARTRRTPKGGVFRSCRSFSALNGCQPKAATSRSTPKSCLLDLT